MTEQIVPTAETLPRPAPAVREASLTTCLGIARRLFDRVRVAVRGRDEVIELVLIALLSDGHVLLEDFPGSGKTTLAKALGEALLDDRAQETRGVIEAFRRIQFTPDLLPSDVTGTSVFEPRTGTFSFRPGPIFAHVVLADEINRTSPKVQAAMLEAMAEKQVTVDNVTRPLDELFFVIATQNPLDLAGTFPLPVAQLDRFLFKIRMTHIEREAELEVLRSIAQRRETPSAPRVSRSEILLARRVIEEQVHVHTLIHESLVDIARALREDRRVIQGVSTRSLVLALPALRARAMIYGRDYVATEDLEAILPRVFGHRLELSAGSAEADAVVADALRPAVERLARASMARG
ncbi:MAG: AAA family ATPase [Deltaproteobacteria bacterium]|nr:AAA family ATPase [Deltaproteobacteria bacterium]